MSGISDGHKKDYRADTILWCYLQKTQSLIGLNYRFKLLFEAVRTVLTIPHSNAGIACLFLLVNKNRNESLDRNIVDIE